MKFPLFQKILIEQAAQKRTYVARIAYGFLLYLIFLTQWKKYTSGYYSAINALGNGRRIFGLTLVFLFATIFFLIPAMAAPAFTREKERNTLDLLLVCKLSPREIVLEKLLAYLLPMFTFLLMAFPAIALCHSLGGITSDYLYTSLYILSITIFQVTTLSLMCSCCARTTTQAICWAYILEILFYFGVCFIPFFFNSLSEKYLLFFPPYILDQCRNKSGSTIFFYSLFILVPSFLFLFLSHFFLLRTKYTKETSKEIQRSIGNKNLNDRIAMVSKPIAWRENHRGAHKKLLLAAFVLILFILIFGINNSNNFNMLPSIYFTGSSQIA